MRTPYHKNEIVSLAPAGVGEGFKEEHLFRSRVSYAKRNLSFKSRKVYSEMLRGISRDRHYINSILNFQMLADKIEIIVKQIRQVVHSPRASVAPPSGALLFLDVVSIKKFAPFVYGRRRTFFRHEK